MRSLYIAWLARIGAGTAHIEGSHFVGGLILPQEKPDGRETFQPAVEGGVTPVHLILSHRTSLVGRV